MEAGKNYEEGMLEFDDLRDVTDLAITATEIEYFAELRVGSNKRSKQPFKKAMLAPKGPGRVAAYGFSKLIEGRAGVEVSVFDEIIDAVKFLGLSEGSTFLRTIKLSLKIH